MGLHQFLERAFQVEQGDIARDAGHNSFCGRQVAFAFLFPACLPQYCRKVKPGLPTYWLKPDTVSEC